MTTTTKKRTGICVFCRKHLVDGREESGFTGVGPDWMTPDGDFGCDRAPETGEEGVGSHRILEEVREVYRIIAEREDPFRAMRWSLYGPREEAPRPLTPEEQERMAVYMEAAKGLFYVDDLASDVQILGQVEPVEGGAWVACRVFVPDASADLQIDPTPGGMGRTTTEAPEEMDDEVDDSHRRYVVDGTDEHGMLTGDGQNPPFRVFDAVTQDHWPVGYMTRQEAEAAIERHWIRHWINSPLSRG